MDDLSISLFASQTLKIHLHGYIQVVAELYLGPDPIFGPNDHYISFSWVAANLTWDHLNHLWTHFIDSGYSNSTHWTYFSLITIKIEQSQAGILSLSWCGMQDIRLKSKKEMTMTIRAQSIPQHGPLFFFYSSCLRGQWSVVWVTFKIPESMQCCIVFITS